MENAAESDAAVLWEDVQALLGEQGFPPNVLAMIKSCVAVDFDGSELTVACASGFARRALEANSAAIEACLAEAAFMPVSLKVEVRRAGAAKPQPTATTISADELARLQQATRATSPAPTPAPAPAKMDQVQICEPAPAPRPHNPLAEEVTPADARLTFETFISGDENRLALAAATQVANGSTHYNPLFIYGKSGMGKTHLLKAIQNYIAANDPSRTCVYRTSRDFVREYADAMQNSSKDVRDALTENYRDVDVLIIDDIQQMRSAQGSLAFFFDTFNYLTDHGKQVVVAADENPSRLGLEQRISSRLGSGATLSVQVPSYELKLSLIQSFYERLRAEAADGLELLDGTISPELLEHMAEVAPDNIREVKGLCQDCLMAAHANEASGRELTARDVDQLAANHGGGAKRREFTVQQIQEFVEGRFDVTHAQMVGPKRNKGIKEPRHIAIWLSRELTDTTFEDIGHRFGDRTHATVMNSIKWVEEQADKDPDLYQRVCAMRDELRGGA